ncbi:branched-chain amino acid transport system ATP-binding protein [Nocardioides sp. BE266]|uniref:ABC transporter ATP-binding protein n=1 Tax=Nocardioides sp. BE266 TaxID=2817725 RepID=UPI00285A1388|nr:ABC transporter ATP-binding protein [Nocardioides sp. BE266]MDR7255085.1 branched-chain amino acid transport system ATP-binding protein [Nocardioides sp. BE266]
MFKQTAEDPSRQDRVDEVVLSARGLVKTFGGVHAIDDLSFDVRRGQVLGLIGPNGAGKTTAVNLISGFVRPTAGSVLLGERDLTGRPPHQLARRGLVRTFQHAHAFASMTVGEALVSAGHVRVGAHRALAWSGLLPRRRARSEMSARAEQILVRTRLERWVDQPCGNLPYGAKKLLGVGMALVLDPELLLLDEPAAGLNSAETAEVLALIEQLRDDGISMVVVEHNMPLIRAVCDELVVLAHGRKIAQGTPDDVTRDETVIGAYLGRR